MNEGTLMHMAVELCHHDYVKYFSLSSIPVNEVNGAYKTPFHVAIDKKNKQIKIRFLKILKLQRLSPFISFSVKDSPLKMCLRQQDVESAYELMQNDMFVNEFLEDLNREPMNEDYITQLLIDCFKLFSEGFKK